MNVVDVARFIFPQTPGRLAVEKSDVGQNLGTSWHLHQCLEHRLSRDGIVRSHPIDRHDRGLGIHLCEDLENVCHALCPCPCGEGMLVRRRRCFHSLAKLLNQPAKDVPNDDSSHAPSRLLQCSQSSEAEGTVNACGDASCG